MDIIETDITQHLLSWRMGELDDEDFARLAAEWALRHWPQTVERHIDGTAIRVLKTQAVVWKTVVTVATPDDEEYWEYGLLGEEVRP